MALPFSFGNQTNPTTPQLDANFGALGNIDWIPCTVTGTNALALTPLPNTPTISSLQNGMRFMAICANTNTGAVTAAIGSIPALSVFKDTSGGPVALVGKEITQACAFGLIYDSALNTGAGGFHLAPGGPVPLGPPLTRQLSVQPVVSYTVLPAQSSQDQPVTLANVAVGDVIALGPPSVVTAGLVFMGYVPAAGTVNVRAINPTASSLSAFSVTIRVMAFGVT